MSIFRGSIRRKGTQNVQRFYGICVLRIKLQSQAEFFLALVHPARTCVEQAEALVKNGYLCTTTTKLQGFIKLRERMRPVMFIG
jgi:hypothetical protein